MRVSANLLIIVLVLCSFGRIQAQVNLNNGLVAHYPFNGNPLDVSGNNQHGVARNGIQLTSDRLGNANSAYAFDGLDDVIAVSDAAQLFSTPHFSLVLWFKTSSNGLQNLVAKRDFGPANGTQYQFFINYPPFPGIGSNVVSDLNSCPSPIANITSYTNTGENICIGRWYCAVVIFDGNTHRIYINGQLRQSIPAGFAAMAQCGSELRFGNWWSGDLIPFQGAMDDIRWYNRPLTEDEVAVLSQGAGKEQSVNADFIMRQLDNCETDRFRFQAVGNGLNNFFWNFGDGQTVAGQSDPEHRFIVPGQYTVQLVAGSGPGCRDTATRLIDTRVAWGNLMANQDTTLCQNSSLVIRPQNALVNCTFVNNIAVSGNQFPALNNVINDSRILAIGRELGPNLIVNGDFASGNTGFTSQYTFTTTAGGSQQYGITTNPRNWSPSIACIQCGGYPEPGGGNFLVASGSNVTGALVWSSLVNVIPNTQYQLQFSANSFDSLPTARLELVINGRSAGFWTPDSGTGRWSTYQADWNAGSSTTLSISILYANFAAGKRFGIDEVSVRSYRTVQDSFRIQVVVPSTLTRSSDSAICPGQSVPLLVSGGLTYQWTPANGLSNTSIPNPIATPLLTTKYLVTATTSSGCPAVDSVLVTVFEAPSINLIADTSVCTGNSIVLQASGADSYTWTPSAGLSSTAISSPTATPAQSTLYRVRFTEGSGCSGEDSVFVSVNAFPVISASADTEICAGEQTRLQANGGASYVWSPVAGLSDPRSSNPVASPSATVRYYVQGFGAGNCFSIDSVLVRVGDTPILSLRSDTVICQGSSLVLAASGAQRYEWFPAEGLSDPFAAAPLATPRVTTRYTVNGFGSTGCIASKSVHISVGADAARIFVPNVFTPNGDGLNDCFKISGGDAATVFEFAIYNRFGERVFLSRNPNECWDGNYRGQQQPTGTFVYYMIIDSPCGPAKTKGTITLLR